ncbi:hypothetical protein BC826DRAFT_972768 [Russula brevipes]|nr:hypothetical protein BC826DRAFT_972768 [Russula brevipes]
MVAAVLGEDEANGSAMGPRVCVRVWVRGWLPGPSTRLHPAASVARRQVDMMWTGLGVGVAFASVADSGLMGCFEVRDLRHAGSGSLASVGILRGARGDSLAGLAVNFAGPVSICTPVCARKRALNASVWGPSGRGAFVAHAPKSSPSLPPPPPLVGGWVAHAVEGSDRWGGTDGMRVRRPHTNIIAFAATTTATRRWMGGAHGRGVGSVWGNGQHDRRERIEVTSTHVAGENTPPTVPSDYLTQGETVWPL